MSELKQDFQRDKQDFQREVEKARKKGMFDDGYKRKKTIVWGIRTILTIVLYIVFWKHVWVRWTLLLYVPLSLINLWGIYGLPKVLQKKIDETEQHIKNVEETHKDNAN